MDEEWGGPTTIVRLALQHAIIRCTYKKGVNDSGGKAHNTKSKWRLSCKLLLQKGDVSPPSHFKTSRGGGAKRSGGKIRKAGNTNKP